MPKDDTQDALEAQLQRIRRKAKDHNLMIFITADKHPDNRRYCIAGLYMPVAEALLDALAGDTGIPRAAVQALRDDISHSYYELSEEYKTVKIIQALDTLLSDSEPEGGEETEQCYLCHGPTDGIYVRAYVDRQWHQSPICKHCHGEVYTAHAQPEPVPVVEILDDCVICRLVGCEWGVVDEGSNGNLFGIPGPDCPGPGKYRLVRVQEAADD